MFTEDQKLTFEYLGNNYLATVTGTLVEAQEEKQSAHRGCGPSWPLLGLTRSSRVI